MGDVVVQRKFGANPDVQTTTDPETVWGAGGILSDYFTPAATTVVSDDTDDDVGGTGAITGIMHYLDSDYMMQEEEFTLDGTTPVALTAQPIFIYRAKILTAGASGYNEGTITFSNGSTLATIEPKEGQTLIAVYPLPKNFVAGIITHWGVQALNKVAAYADFSLQTKKIGGAWNTRDKLGSSGEMNPNDLDIRIEPGELVRIQCNEVSANMPVIGYFIIDQHRNHAGI